MHIQATARTYHHRRERHEIVHQPCRLWLNTSRSEATTQQHVWVNRFGFSFTLIVWIVLIFCQECEHDLYLHFGTLVVFTSNNNQLHYVKKHFQTKFEMYALWVFFLNAIRIILQRRVKERLIQSQRAFILREEQRMGIVRRPRNLPVKNDKSPNSSRRTLKESNESLRTNAKLQLDRIDAKLEKVKAERASTLSHGVTQVRKQ